MTAKRETQRRTFLKESEGDDYGGREKAHTYCTRLAMDNR